MRVGVFDSGIGGLTVLKKLYMHYPNNEYIYYGDTINLPYGNKQQDELNLLSSQDVEFLLDKGVEIIIIACGTVSANCLNYLKNKYQVPIYDIITPTIDYLNNSDYTNIGIIATNATINSHVFKNKINKNVYEIKTPEFVLIIENNLMDRLDATINNYLSFVKDKIDVLVLGCTHYPIIKDSISKYLGDNVKLLDMSDLLLDKLNDDDVSKITIYFSNLNDMIIDNTKRILGIYNVNIMIKE